MPFTVCRGADIHLPDVENDTPLMIAAYDGHADVVRLLIKLGARLDQLDKVREHCCYYY